MSEKNLEKEAKKVYRIISENEGSLESNEAKNHPWISRIKDLAKKVGLGRLVKTNAEQAKDYARRAGEYAAEGRDKEARNTLAEAYLTLARIYLDELSSSKEEDISQLTKYEEAWQEKERLEAEYEKGGSKAVKDIRESQKERNAEEISRQEPHTRTINERRRNYTKQTLEFLGKAQEHYTQSGNQKGMGDAIDALLECSKIARETLPPVSKRKTLEHHVQAAALIFLSAGIILSIKAITITGGAFFENILSNPPALIGAGLFIIGIALGIICLYRKNKA